MISVSFHLRSEAVIEFQESLRLVGSLGRCLMSLSVGHDEEWLESEAVKPITLALKVPV